MASRYYTDNLRRLHLISYFCIASWRRRNRISWGDIQKWKMENYRQKYMSLHWDARSKVRDQLAEMVQLCNKLSKSSEKLNYSQTIKLNRIVEIMKNVNELTKNAIK